MSSSLPYILVKPVTCTPPLVPRIHTSCTPRLIKEILSALRPGEFLSLDFETKGDVADQHDSRTVGVALSSESRVDYIDFRSDTNAYELIMHTLAGHNTPLMAHNVYFDSSWPLRDFGLWLNWRVCTFALFKHIANEGFFNQKWGLKDAQVNLLGWESSNEERLDRWLIDNGHFQSISKKFKVSGYLYPEWPIKQGRAVGPRYVIPRKEMMYLAPTDILGWYACMDAWSTHALFYKVLAPAAEKFSEFCDFMGNEYMEYMEILVRQKLRGMQVDKSHLDWYEEELTRRFAKTVEEFTQHPAVLPILRERREEELRDARVNPPVQYKKRKGPQTMPSQFTKTGTITKSYMSWLAYQELPLEETYSYELWRRDMAALENSPLVNPTSPDELRWLLYDKLGFPKEVWTKTKNKNRSSGLPPPEPKPSTDKEALQAMGEVGELIIRYQRFDKIRQFCATVKKELWDDNTLHPGFSVPGTLTGRLGGRRPNCQNQPKDLEFLRIYQTRPGYKMITCDVNSLENYVLTELSQDSALLGLYGPNAREGQDSYLYNIAQLPGIGDEVKARGYNPLTANAAETAKAKKASKKEREVGKVLTLSGNYGAGPGKMQMSLKSKGIHYSIEEVQNLHKAFWELYRGVKTYGYELERQWKKNRGWTIDGLGHPVCVDEKYKKDIVNRVVQRTGHTAFVKLVTIVDRMFKKENLEAHALICDLHDCMIYEVADEDVPRAVEIMEIDGYKILNEWLRASAPLRGESKVCNYWSDDKDEKIKSLYTLKDGWNEETKPAK